VFQEVLEQDASALRGTWGTIASTSKDLGINGNIDLASLPVMEMDAMEVHLS